MIEYTLIRSNRKTLALHILRDGQVEVRAPLKMSITIIEDFIQRKQNWISKKVLLVKQNQAIPKTYTEGEEFLYLGINYRLTFIDRVKPVIDLDGQILIAQRCRAKVEKIIRRWYKCEAEQILKHRVEVFAMEMNLQPKSVRITSAKQRWGSCSIKGNINLNWRLILAPIEIVDYVVVHELAHMKQHNHSPAFWEVVQSIIPDYKTKRAWLKSNSNLLLL